MNPDGEHLPLGELENKVINIIHYSINNQRLLATTWLVYGAYCLQSGLLLGHLISANIGKAACFIIFA